MNKYELAKKIQNKFNNFEEDNSITIDKAKTIIEMILGKIIDELNETGSSFVEGLGTFKVREVPKRKVIIKSPLAGKKQNKEIEIGGYKKIVFKAHKSSNNLIK